VTQPQVAPTNELERSRRIRRATLVGLAYFGIAMVFGALAGATGGGFRVAWRLAAWLISAALFAWNVRLEYAVLDNPPATAARRAAVAVAWGAFAVAVVAYSRSRMASSPHSAHLLLAFLIWPVLTGGVAFIVAFAATSIAGIVARRFQ
jgi:hypothetical protein